MDNRDKVKIDILRRKYMEHFRKNPKSKSVVIKADVGPVKTLWRVLREGRDFRIVEVNTTREEFIITEASPKEKMFSDIGEDKPKKSKKPKRPEKSRPEPTDPLASSDKPPGAEMASSPEGEPDEIEKIEKPEAGPDVGGPEGSPEGAPQGDPEADMGTPEVKSAEEERLQKMVHNKPIQNISVSSDSDKGTISLQLGGLKNPLEISIFDSGKVTYRLGNLSQLLKPSA